jgi:hydroxymethylbilane synthase
MKSERTLFLATRGSALALAQTRMVLAQCRAAFPDWSFEIKIIKTTGDKLQTASLASANLPKGLFTKELEAALLSGEADLAVHSLKDLPTELPAGLKLGAAGKRADVRDVLLCRREAVPTGGTLAISALRQDAVVATSSTRRRAQLLEKRPDLKIVPIRGNVGTRLNKLATQADLDAIVLAAAGLERLEIAAAQDSPLRGEGVPDGLLAAPIDPGEMIPCVGQAALGIEIRENDPLADHLCAALNDEPTMLAIRAERAFLRAMGGGCQMPVAAYARVEQNELTMRVVSFLGDRPRRADGRGPTTAPEELGMKLAEKVGS